MSVHLQEVADVEVDDAAASTVSVSVVSVSASAAEVDRLKHVSVRSTCRRCAVTLTSTTRVTRT